LLELEYVIDSRWEGKNSEMADGFIRGVIDEK